MRLWIRLLAICALGATAAVPASAQQVPQMPAPVAVSLTGSTTAVLVLDVIDGICGRQAKCTALVPHMASIVAAARKAGALIVFSAAEARSLTAPTVQPSFLPTLPPAQGDPVIIGGAQDRFFGTLLDQMLRRRGIATLVLMGWRENGSLLYTAVSANLLNYTVVVAEDATSASEDYDVAIGRYQLLTELNSNPKNEPLHKGAVTLSRSDLIGFK